VLYSVTLRVRVIGHIVEAAAKRDICGVLMHDESVIFALHWCYIVLHCACASFVISLCAVKRDISGVTLHSDIK